MQSTLPLISVTSTPDDNSFNSVANLDTPEGVPPLSFRTPANVDQSDERPPPPVGKLFMTENNSMCTPAMPR